MPRAPIPPSALFRPLPLSRATYPLRVSPAPTHPPSCTALGRGLGAAVAGVEARFVVEARDEHGNLRLAGGDVVSAVGVGPGLASFTADVEDRGDGTYLVSYYATAAGRWRLAVTVGSAGLHRDFGFANVEEVRGGVRRAFKNKLSHSNTLTCPCLVRKRVIFLYAVVV